MGADGVWRMDERTPCSGIVFCIHVNSILAAVCMPPQSRLVMGHCSIHVCVFVCVLYACLCLSVENACVLVSQSVCCMCLGAFVVGLCLCI